MMNREMGKETEGVYKTVIHKLTLEFKEGSWEHWTGSRATEGLVGTRTFAAEASIDLNATKQPIQNYLKIPVLIFCFLICDNEDVILQAILCHLVKVMWPLISLQSTILYPVFIAPWASKWNELPPSMNWRRQWHPTPVLLPGKSHGRRSLVGCSPWGR